MKSSKDPYMDNEKYIEELEHEIVFLKNLVSAYENVAHFRDKEHQEAINTVNAYSRLSELSAAERKNDRDVIQALEETTDLAANERYADRAVIDAFEKAQDLADMEREDVKKILVAYEQLATLSREKKREVRDIISAYENMIELSDDEKKKLQEIIDAYEQLNNLVSQEQKQQRSMIEAYERLEDFHEQEHLNALSTIDAMEKASVLTREEIIQFKERFDNIKTIVHPLEKEILAILDEDSENEQHLLTKLNLLNIRKNDNNFYSHLFNVLINIDFEEEQAVKYWEDIIALNKSDSEKLGRKISFRVSLLDYFIDNNRHLKNPKIIEFTFYESTLSAAVFDKLTGLLNRTYMTVALKSAQRNAHRKSRRFGVIMFDIDNFKQFNDFFGHLEGDKLLKSLSTMLQETFRIPHSVFRYGGEEFLAIVETESQDDIFHMADKVRMRFYDQWETCVVPVSLSAGYDMYTLDDRVVEDLVSRADKALYDAKYSGKNIVLRYSESRRQNSRLVKQSEVAVTLEGHQTSIDNKIALTVDVSKSGLSLEMDTKPVISQGISILLDPRNRDEGSRLHGKIAWVKEECQGKYIVGVELDNSDDSKEVYLQFGGKNQQKDVE